ncbi:MAG: TetR family transcriptional regulator [Oscillospiraceae bacterium]
MPPKVKVTKEDIVSAAVDVVREKGAAALNARAVAARLGTSTQPIFSHYTTMEALHSDVISYADKLYQSFLQRDMSSGEYPAYKGSGMAYIRFAQEERELF